MACCIARVETVLLTGPCGLDPDAVAETSGDNETPIHKACSDRVTARKDAGNPDVVRVLLALGADPNITDNDEYTPCTWTARFSGSVPVQFGQLANLQYLCVRHSPTKTLLV